ncbi:hypothetical protein BGM19_01375 [Streptomyces agglomeratus]|nr:hypothetical protein BGM19_01375 [Streptomyces agglomeratus]
MTHHSFLTCENTLLASPSHRSFYSRFFGDLNDGRAPSVPRRIDLQQDCLAAGSPIGIFGLPVHSSDSSCYTPEAPETAKHRAFL